MSSTSGIFAGNSRYASDFTSVIDRAVGIASLPMVQMQNMRNALSSRSDALSSLDSKVAAVQSAVASLGSSLCLNSYRVNVTSAGILSTSASDGLTEGTYSIEVTHFGSNANTMSKAPGAGIAKVASPAEDGFGSAGPFKLYLNTDDDSKAVTVKPASGSLNDLVAAINQASSDVHAAVVNVGGAGGPDYRLTIQHNKLGPNSIQLKNESGTALLDTLAGGEMAGYKINGGSEISNDTRSITLAPGLNVDLLKQSDPGVATTVTVTREAGNVRNALSAFARAYNALVDQLDQNRGKGNGALKGESILSSVSDIMRTVTGYSTGEAGISLLTSLGLAFDDQGKLSVDPDEFGKATQGHFDDLAAFLGSATGGGFLKAATDAMNSLEDSANGLLPTDISSVKKQIADQDSRISAEQERVDQIRTDMQARMAAADALIAQMEQQVSYLTNMFEAMRTSGYNK
jgi:flagellar hook-associated protein 2